jgi:hypothetical protein
MHAQTNQLSVPNNLNATHTNMTSNIHPIINNLNTTQMPTTNLNTSSIVNHQSNNNININPRTYNQNPPQFLNNNNKLNHPSLSNNSLQINNNNNLILNELNTCNNTIFDLEIRIELLLKELSNDQYEFIKRFGSQERTSRHEVLL